MSPTCGYRVLLNQKGQPGWRSMDPATEALEVSARWTGHRAPPWLGVEPEGLAVDPRG